MQPNYLNYEYLYALYGSFDNSTTSAPTAASNSQSTAAPTIAPTVQATTAATATPTMSPTVKTTTRNRKLYEKPNQPLQLERSPTEWNDVVSDHIQNFDRADMAQRGWRLLQESPYAELHEYRLDEANTIQAYILLAQ
jgi:hypothetical protein